jgi:hypothetical protein
VGPVGTDVGEDRDRGSPRPVGHAGPARLAASGRVNVTLVPRLRPKREVALPGECLAEGPPARGEPIGDVLEARPGRNRSDELLAGEWPALERLADRAAERLHHRWGDAEVAHPARSLPGPAGRHEGQERAALLGRDEMERPAHGPGLDEAALDDGPGDRSLGCSLPDPTASSADEALRKLAHRRTSDRDSGEWIRNCPSARRGRVAADRDRHRARLARHSRGASPEPGESPRRRPAMSDARVPASPTPMTLPTSPGQTGFLARALQG